MTERGRNGCINSPVTEYRRLRLPVSSVPSGTWVLNPATRTTNRKRKRTGQTGRFVLSWNRTYYRRYITVTPQRRTIIARRNFLYYEEQEQEHPAPWLVEILTTVKGRNAPTWGRTGGTPARYWLGRPPDRLGTVRYGLGVTPVGLGITERWRLGVTAVGRCGFIPVGRNQGGTVGRSNVVIKRIKRGCSLII